MSTYRGGVTGQVTAVAAARLLTGRETRAQRATEEREECAAVRPNDISYKVIGAAMAVHTALGPGLLESAYEKALCREFETRKLQFRRQVRISIAYNDVDIANA